MPPTTDTAPAQLRNKVAGENAAPPEAALLHMATGAWVAQALYVVAKFGLADLLVAGPRSATDLAKITGTHAGALYRILRALASVNVFAEDEVGLFHLTPTAECLCTKVGSLRAFVIMLGEQEHWRAWGEIVYSVKTGQPAFDHVFRMPRFQYFADHPDDARIFSEAMTSRGSQENDAIISAYDFSNLKSIVDVGGGQGSLLVAILRATSDIRGVLFDLPGVIAVARSAVSPTEETARYALVEGNFFKAIPVGADAYLLKKVIQDWDDERAIEILINCRRAMRRDGRLLLIEPVIPPGNIHSFNKLLDLLLLVWTPGGKARTEREHEELLTKAGLKISRVISTESWLSLLEALPAD